MGQARDDAGNIWETDAQGNAVRLLQAAGGQQGQVFTLPTSPEKQAQLDRELARDAATEADRAADNARADRELSLREEAAAKDRTGTANQRAEWRANLSNIGLLETTLADLRQQYETHFRGKGLQSVAEEFAPARFAPQYGVFDTTAQSMLADMAKAKGLTAQQFNTPAEQRMFFEPLIPKRGDPDEVIESKLANLERMIATGRASTERNLGIAQQRADNEVPGQANGAATKPPPGVGGDPGDLPPANAPGGNQPTPPPSDNVWDANHDLGGRGTDTGMFGFGEGTREVDHPEIRSMVASLINSGAGFATVNAALKEAKWAKPVSLQEWNAIQQWRAANPGKPYPASSVNATETVPLSLRERVSGSDVGAGAAHMSNALTAGIPAYLAGEEGERALDAMAAAHPDSALTGTVIGGVGGAMGAEAALAARAPLALVRYAPRIADALYGATSGFTGAEDGQRLGGALTGAVLAPIAGKTGELAMRGVGAAARGVTDPAVNYLRDARVPLTVGQTLGGAAKKIEDALTSIPGVGNMVEARRTAGLEGFNRAAFDVGAETTGGQVQDIGTAGLRQLEQLKTDAYSRALDPVMIDANTPQFLADLAAAKRSAQLIPNVNGAQDAALAGLRSRIDGAVNPATDTISGRDFQEAYRGLARTGRERAAGDYGHEIGQAMRQGQDALVGALEEQNPGAYAAFTDANAANRRLNILADAVGRARNADNDIFTPAQLEAADFASANKLTGKVAAASGDRPFAELASAGQEVLPSRLPDSGTWTRALVGAGLTGAFGGVGAAAGGAEGAGAGTGLGLAANAALMLGGTRAGQRLMTELLLNRPDVLRAAGEGLKRRAQLGGGFGAGVITPLLVGP